MKDLLDALPNNRKVICITGGIAAGKSLAMSILANELHKELGASAFTNYGLANALPLKLREHASHFMSPEEYEIISIDEGDHVFAFSPYFMDHFLSEYKKDSNLILIFTSFSENRIPKESRKKVDLFLNVKKDGENGEIHISGVNKPYQRTLKIEECLHYYNAFQKVQTDL